MAYQLTNGRWRGQVGSGKNRKTCSTFRTRSQAESWEADNTLDPSVDHTTWNDISDLYFASSAFREKALRTQRGERVKSIPVLRYFGTRLVANTDDLVVDDYKEERLATVNAKTGNKLAGHTVRLELAFLSTLVNLAVKRRHLAESFMPLVAKPATKNKVDRIAKKDLAILFMSDCFKPPDPAFIFFRLLYALGCRAGELSDLTIDHVDLPKKQLFFPHTKNSRPRLALIPSAYEFGLLVMWLKRPDRDPKCPYVFPTRDRKTGEWKPFHYSGYWARVKQIFGDKLSPNISPHTFRHERISRWFESGLNVGQIMELSGHLSPLSLNIYRHIQAEVLRPVVTALQDEDAETMLDMHLKLISSGIKPDEVHSYDLESHLALL